MDIDIAKLKTYVKVGLNTKSHTDLQSEIGTLTKSKLLTSLVFNNWLIYLLFIYSFIYLFPIFNLTMFLYVLLGFVLCSGYYFIFRKTISFWLHLRNSVLASLLSLCCAVFFSESLWDDFVSWILSLVTNLNSYDIFDIQIYFFYNGWLFLISSILVLWLIYPLLLRINLISLKKLHIFLIILIVVFLIIHILFFSARCAIDPTSIGELSCHAYKGALFASKSECAIAGDIFLSGVIEPENKYDASSVILACYKSVAIRTSDVNSCVEAMAKTDTYYNSCFNYFDETDFDLSTCTSNDCLRAYLRINKNIDRAFCDSFDIENELYLICNYRVDLIQTGRSECGSIKGLTQKSHCIGLNTVKTEQDIDLCNSNSSYLQDICLKAIGLGSTQLYSRVCSNFSTSKGIADCESFVANNGLNSCEYLSNSSLSDLCYMRSAYSINDVSLCINISTLSLKDVCYEKLARKTLSIDLCVNIQNESMNYNCINSLLRINVQKNTCSKINDSILKSKCDRAEYDLSLKEVSDREVKSWTNSLIVVYLYFFTFIVIIISLIALVVLYYPHLKRRFKKS